MTITMYSFVEELGYLKSLADYYHLVFDLSDSNNALLIDGDFIISVTVDREEARIWYYDARDPEGLREYALDFLLYRIRRRIAPEKVEYASNQERVQADLREAITRLATDATDVLSGQREWFAEYIWDTSIIIGGKRTVFLTALLKARQKMAAPSVS